MLKKKKLTSILEKSFAGSGVPKASSFPHQHGGIFEIVKQLCTTWNFLGSAPFSGKRCTFCPNPPPFTH